MKHKVLLPQEFIEQSEEYLDQLMQCKLSKITILENQVIPSVIMMTQAQYNKICKSNDQDAPYTPSLPSEKEFDESNLTKEEGMFLTIKHRVKFFNGLSNKESIDVTKKITFIRPKEGKMLFEQGSNSKEIYYIIKGIVSILTLDHFKEYTEIAALDPNMVFGELACIENSRSARATIKSEEALLLKIELKDDFDDQNTKAFTKLYKNMLEAVASKLIKSNNQMLSFVS